MTIKEELDLLRKDVKDAVELIEEKDDIAMQLNESLVGTIMEYTDAAKTVDKLLHNKKFKKVVAYFDGIDGSVPDGKISLEEGRKGVKKLFSNGYISLFLGALAGLVMLIVYNVLTMYFSGEEINWVALNWFGQYIIPAFFIVLGAKPGYKQIMEHWSQDKEKKEELAVSLSQKEKEMCEADHRHELDLMEKDFQIRIKDELNRVK